MTMERSAKDYAYDMFCQQSGEVKIGYAAFSAGWDAREKEGLAEHYVQQIDEFQPGDRALLAKRIINALNLPDDRPIVDHVAGLIRQAEKRNAAASSIMRRLHEIGKVVDRIDAKTDAMMETPVDESGQSSGFSLEPIVPPLGGKTAKEWDDLNKSRDFWRRMASLKENTIRDLYSLIDALRGPGQE
jgi:hypothetical protein